MHELHDTLVPVDQFVSSTDNQWVWIKFEIIHFWRYQLESWVQSGESNRVTVALNSAILFSTQIQTSLQLPTDVTVLETTEIVASVVLYGPGGAIAGVCDKYSCSCNYGFDNVAYGVCTPRPGQLVNQVSQISNQVQQPPNQAEQQSVQFSQQSNQTPQESNQKPQSPQQSNQTPQKSNQKAQIAQNSNQTPQSPQHSNQTPQQSSQTPQTAQQSNQRPQHSNQVPQVSRQ